MSDLNHIIYSSASYVITIILFLLFNVIKSQNKKDNILKISAVLTVIIHYSSLYVDYFTTGIAVIESSMLLPIFPCNVAMWLLVVVAFKKNKNDKLFRLLAEMTFYLGTFGASIGLIFNENYIMNPDLTNYTILKGLMSHSTLVFGSMYLAVGGYMKIRLRNVIIVIIVNVGLLVHGGLVILLYKVCDIAPPNVMFLIELPYPSYPWINTFTVTCAVLVLSLLFTITCEQIFVPKEERWYVRLKK